MGVDTNPFIKLPVLEWDNERKVFKKRNVRFRMDDIMRYELYHPSQDQTSSPECRNGEITKVYYKRYAEQVNDITVIRTAMMVVAMDLAAMDLMFNVFD
jgi:hypothetical protein